MSATATPKLPRSKEIHSDEMPISQKDDVVLSPLDEAYARESDIISVNQDQLHQDYQEALAFNREPVMIHIEVGTEEFPPASHDCSINGEGAEVFDPGSQKWMRLGALPVGMDIITRRMYVERLASSKIDKIRTEHEGAHVEKPRNYIRRTTTGNIKFRIIEDRNPKGREWARRVFHFN